MSRRNISSALKGRRSADPMREFDALPPELRRWLSEALGRLERAERATLRRDALARL